MAVHTIGDLRQMQSLSLDAKVRMTIARVEAWIREFGEEGVYISFSGGKDSTVLMDIIRNEMGYNIPAMFVDVPTQYPELREFAKTWDNVEIMQPSINFVQVCEKYGFPLISKETSECVQGARKYLRNLEKGSTEYSYFYEKITGTGKYNGQELAKLMHQDKYKKNGSVARLANLLGMNTRDNNYSAKEDIQKGDKSKYSQEKWNFFLDAPFEISNKCCIVMKKEPAHQYSKKTGRKPITAQMADESRLRTQQWLKNGCNGFDMKLPISNPMSFWTEQDVLKYIFDNKLPICSVYGDVVIDFDAMGEYEGQVVFKEFEQDIKYKTTGCNRTGCMLCGFGCHLEKPEESRFLQLKETHPKMLNLLDMCKNNGVTFREAIEWTNEHLKDSQKILL